MPSDASYYLSTFTFTSSLYSQHTRSHHGPVITCEGGHEHLTTPNQYEEYPKESRTGTYQRVKTSFQDSVLDVYAAIKIFMIHLVTFESLFVVLCSVIATTGYYIYGQSSTGASFGANISWTMVTFAVVAPMIMQIKQAFARRELALENIAEANSLFCNILLAHALWNWEGNGRQKLPPSHVHKTKTFLKTLVHDMVTLLKLPTVTRGRHRLTAPGRKMASQFIRSVDQLHMHIVQSFHRLHEQVEVMKNAGFPVSEASRINQYHWLLQARLEKLQNIKFYRTPQATRSFTRLFILLLPIYYGPYYVYIARGNESNATNFAFCLFLSVITSLTMIGIFNVEEALEDPFAGGGLDGIRVHELQQHIYMLLDTCYDNKVMAPSPALPHEWAHTRVDNSGGQVEIVVTSHV